MNSDVLSQLLWAEYVSIGGFSTDALYGIGTVIVALATLVGAYATYRSIKDRSQLRSYDELEAELEATRKDFREQLKNRDLEHQEERDNNDAKWRHAIDIKTAEFRSELDQLKELQRQTQFEVGELKRVNVSAIAHIDKQNHRLREVGIEPGPLPIEIEIFRNRQVGSGEN